MTTNIIVALLVAIAVFFILVAVWYFVAVPAKRKALTEEARENGGALVNGQRIPAQAYYETIGGQGTNAIGAYYIYSMTNVRLAEVTLGYDIPIKKLVPWIDALNIAFVGRNLAMIYCKAPFDPELVQGAGNYGSGIDYFMVPSTRNLGFSAKVTFGGNSAKKTVAAPAHVEPYVVEKEVVKEVVKEVPVEVVKEVVKEVVVAPKGKIYEEDINFLLGKSEIRPDEAFKLGRIFQTLEAYPDAKIEITGYADTATGTAEINRRLSKERVENVSKKLQEKGIPASRISVNVGEGDWDATQSPEANRRVTVRIVNN